MKWPEVTERHARDSRVRACPSCHRLGRQAHRHGCWTVGRARAPPAVLRSAVRLSVAATAARASSVLVTRALACETFTTGPETGTDSPLSARASSVLKAGRWCATVALVDSGTDFCPASARASSLVVGIGFAFAAPAVAIESASAAASEKPNLAIICWIVFIFLSLWVPTMCLGPPRCVMGSGRAM
jgi:hypothetical protein